MNKTCNHNFIESKDGLITTYKCECGEECHYKENVGWLSPAVGWKRGEIYIMAAKSDVGKSKLKEMTHDQNDV